MRCCKRGVRIPVFPLLLVSCLCLTGCGVGGFHYWADRPADPRFEGRYLHQYPGICSIGTDDTCEVTFLVNHIARAVEREEGEYTYTYNGVVTLTAFQSGTVAHYGWDLLLFTGMVTGLGEARGTLTVSSGEREEQYCPDTATVTLIAGESEGSPDELQLSCPGFEYTALRQTP